MTQLETRLIRLEQCVNHSEATLEVTIQRFSDAPLPAAHKAKTIAGRDLVIQYARATP